MGIKFYYKFILLIISIPVKYIIAALLVIKLFNKILVYKYYFSRSKCCHLQYLTMSIKLFIFVNENGLLIIYIFK